MSVRGSQLRDVPLIVEDLLVGAEEQHRAGAPAREVDEQLALARALLAGEAVEVELPLEWETDGQA